MTDADTLVVGGGPAGAACALALARAGHQVTLIDRAAAPREVVCGEFLGPDAVALLAELGCVPAELGALPLARARLAWRDRVTELALPFTGWGLSRQVLDAHVLALAEAAGASVLRGRTVVAAAPERDQAGWSVRLADSTRVTARRLVLATGKHDLRGHARRAASHGGWIGLKLHLAMTPPEGTLLLPCPGGYAGLQPTPGGGANLCVALRALPARADGQPPRAASDLLARVAAGSRLAATMLADAQPMQARPLAVGRVPYGFLYAPKPDAPAGLYCIGDQFAVVPSCCGDGVAMALAGGLQAAGAILADISAARFHAAWRHSLSRPMRWANGLGWLLVTTPRSLGWLAGISPAASRLVAQRTRAI